MGEINVTRRQSLLLCAIATDGAINALLFSPYRAEGPKLREMGLIVGLGDSTRISAEAHALLRATATPDPLRERREGGGR